jgi:hypothetical protein
VVVRQELPPPVARQVYELTEDGRDLADAMVPLVAWGMRRLGARKSTESFRPQWAALAMAFFANREAARGVSETYQYVVGRLEFTSRRTTARIQLHGGRAQEPAVTVTTDEETWHVIGSAAAIGLVAYFVGAFATTVHARAWSHIPYLLVFLLPSAASLTPLLAST